MKILVYVKQVPDTVEAKIDPKTGNLMREGMQSRMNPLDANAVETALRLKEKHGGTVVAITMGPPQANAVLRRALSMGCDEAVLLSDRALGGADTLATGYPLAKAAEKIGGYDILLCGRHATDAETAQTGPIIAAFLGIPQVTLCGDIEVEDGWATCERLLPDCTETVRVKLPALMTVCAEANTPRYASALGIKRAAAKPRYVWNVAELGADPEMCGGKGSPSVNKEIFEPEKPSLDTVYFTGSAAEMAKQIADVLADADLI